MAALVVDEEGLLPSLRSLPPGPRHVSLFAFHSAVEDIVLLVENTCCSCMLCFFHGSLNSQLNYEHALSQFFTNMSTQPFCLKETFYKNNRLGQQTCVHSKHSTSSRCYLGTLTGKGRESFFTVSHRRRSSSPSSGSKRANMHVPGWGILRNLRRKRMPPPQAA